MILKSITLKNLATISDTSLEFERGLNVLTGETGSGKSILVDGLMLATGKRADRSLVRPGTRNASVEAVFLDPAAGETIVRREISLDGRSRVFIDDSLSTLDEVRAAVRHFAELHSQRSTPDLLKSSRQLEIVDDFAGTTGLREAFNGEFTGYRGALSKIERLRSFIQSSASSREILLHEMNMFQELVPSEQDYAELTRRERELRNAARHAVLFGQSEDILQGENGVSSLLTSVLGNIQRESPGSGAIIDLLEQASIAVNEASSLIAREISTGEDAPGMMAEIERRLDRYSELMSRFGGTLEGMLAAGESLSERLREFDDAEASLEELELFAEKASRGLVEMAEELSGKRRRGAEELSRRVCGEIRSLNMPHADFHVEFRDPVKAISVGGAELGSTGAETAVFMFTANRGIPPDTLESVASGGELSRVALALALSLADSGSASTLIFDEIDSGTGGETAHLLADSLLRAAGSRQIIVISHLAQIASRAHRHMAVEKTFSSEMPATVVNHLDTRKKRLGELTRLLGGGDGAAAHAARLLEAGS